jgi:hypothetical protein
MTPEIFLAYLLRRGSTVYVIGDKIRVEAPSGVLTPEIRAGVGDTQACPFAPARVRGPVP